MTRITTQLSLDGERRAVTVEPERLFHYISDEELQLMQADEATIFSQTFWAATGALVGALPGAVAAAASLSAGMVGGWGEMTALALACAALAGGSVALFGWRREKRRIETIQARIRARPRVVVGPSPVIDIGGAGTDETA